MHRSTPTSSALRHALLLSIALGVGCGGDDPLSLGTPCSSSNPSACESGICASGGSIGGICTQACSDTTPCPRVGGIGQLVCDPATSLCQEPCAVDETRLIGGETYVCRGSAFVACTDLTDADCGVCGCDLYGGGVCLPVGGCVEPKMDGAACTYAIECTSGACYYQSGTCGAPLALDAPCYADEDCASGNCSNDGDHASAGVCNMAFGDPCASAPTDCNLCVGTGPLSDGWCIRRFCNPDDPHPCPTGVSTAPGSSRDWDCLRGADDMYRCYEDCTGHSGPYACLETPFLCNLDNHCY